jgi:hypothetical protein
MLRSFAATMGLAGGGAAVVQAGLQQYSSSMRCGENTGRWVAAAAKLHRLYSIIQRCRPVPDDAEKQANPNVASCPLALLKCNVISRCHGGSHTLYSLIAELSPICFAC